MKPTCCLLLLAVLSSQGCVMFGREWSMKKPSPPETPVKVEKPAKPVAPEQINETNAHEKAKALFEELDRDKKPSRP